MTVIVTLGPFLLADFEVPESITGGGTYDLIKHKLIGGRRVFNAMGADDDKIKFSGRFRGGDAEFRAKFFNYTYHQGKSLPFQYSGFKYTVLIAEYNFKYLRPQEIEYSIALEIVTDVLNPVLTALFKVDQAIGDSMNQALQIAANLNLPGVESAIATVQSTTATVQSFEGTAANMAGASLDAISAAQSVIGSATSIADAATTAGSSIMSAGSSVSSMASSLTSQADSLLQSSGLRDLGSQLGTMTKNITGAIG